jgi:lysophospholipid acyltransferase (LPLAT)-like uncharacterized protein
LPKPFSKVVVVIGAPISSSVEDSSEADLLRVQSALDEVSKTADSFFS